MESASEGRPLHATHKNETLPRTCQWQTLTNATVGVTVVVTQNKQTLVSVPCPVRFDALIIEKPNEGQRQLKWSHKA
jgi:hypothetical protein